MRLFKEKSPDLEKIKNKATVALHVCEKKVRDLNDIIDDNVIKLIIVK
jgi:hypothetical protein